MASVTNRTNQIADEQTRQAVYELLEAARQDIAELRSDAIISATTLSTGSTAANVANTAFTYRIDGMPYAKAAVTAGTALGITDTINTGTATGLFFGGFAAQINAAGTITFKPAAADQVLTSEAAGYAAAVGIEATAANVIIGYFVVGANADSAWVAGTDDLTPASDCVSATYYAISTAQNLAV